MPYNQTLPSPPSPSQEELPPQFLSDAEGRAHLNTAYSARVRTEEN